jgi:hypothetical protein
VKRIQIGAAIAGIVLIAGASAAVVLAVAGLPYGILDYKQFGNAYTESVYHLAIDADPSNGSGPCAPVDSTRKVGTSDTYQVAICVENQPEPPQEFAVRVIYDGELNIAPECADDPENPLPEEIKCAAPDDTPPALDDNPDANAGTTTWPNACGQTLGDQWDCSFSGSIFPKGDDPNTPSQSDAIIRCLSTRALPQLYCSGALAMVTFRSTGFGREALTFDADTSISGENESHTCGGSFPPPIPCLGATILKSDCDCYLEDNRGQGTSLCITGQDWKFSWLGGSASGTGRVMRFSYLTAVAGRAQGVWLFGTFRCPSGPGSGFAIVQSRLPFRMFRLVDTTQGD